MKKNIDISEFDKFFKEGLENAAQTPPAGVWESVSGSLTSTTATTTAVVKTALWLKVGVAIIATSAVILTSVYLTDSEKEPLPAAQVQEVTNPVIPNNTPAITDQAERPTPKQANQKTESVSIISDQKAGTPSYNNVPYPGDNELPKEIVELPAYDNPVVLPNEVVPPAPKADIRKKDTTTIAKNEDESEGEFKGNIVLKTSDSVLIIPNAFTPNGDGINDTYLIDIKGEERVRIVVLDRNGSKIFETTDKTKGWDPSVESFPVGTYFVVVYYKFPNSPEKSKSQPIVLKR